MAKCVNCRYKAVIDGEDDHGRICANGKDVYLRSDVRGLPVVSWDGFERGFTGKEVKGFEIVPRDPETYRDWQVGDRVNISDTHTCWEELVEVIFRSGELVVCKDSENNAMETKTCDQLYREGGRLVLTDIERQIIEEKKRYEPQDGDICYVRTSAGNCFIFIKKDSEVEEEIHSYASIDTNSRYLFPAKLSCVCCKEDIRELRPATDEEKQKLFDAMSKEGKRWNAEKKVVEDIPKPYEFKKGEPVLVRGYEFHRWIIAAYVDKDKLGFIANAGVSVIHWKYCLPYNEKTMHMLGTNEDYKEGE